MSLRSLHGLVRAEERRGQPEKLVRDRVGAHVDVEQQRLEVVADRHAQPLVDLLVLPIEATLAPTFLPAPFRHGAKLELKGDGFLSWAPYRKLRL